MYSCAFVEGALVVDQDLADIVGQVVAQRARDRVAFLVDQEGGAAALGRLGDRFPLGLEVVQIPLQLLGGAADAGGANDRAHAVGHLQLAHDLAHLVAVLALDAARDAAGARVVRHQDQEAARQTDEGREGRALVAALLLLNLDHQFLAFGDQFADVQPRPAAGLRKYSREISLSGRKPCRCAP